MATVEEILQFTNGAKLIIAVDTNCRSTTWYDVISNSRGRLLEEFLASNQLHLANQESERFTFENSRGSSNIDLTITNTQLLAEISYWEISDEESCSDHNILKYNLGITHHYNHKHSFQYLRYAVKETKLLELTKMY